MITAISPDRLRCDCCDNEWTPAIEGRIPQACPQCGRHAFQKLRRDMDDDLTFTAQRAAEATVPAQVEAASIGRTFASRPHRRCSRCGSEDHDVRTCPSEPPDAVIPGTAVASGMSNAATELPPSEIEKVSAAADDEIPVWAWFGQGLPYKGPEPVHTAASALALRFEYVRLLFAKIRNNTQILEGPNLYDRVESAIDAIEYVMAVASAVSSRVQGREAVLPPSDVENRHLTPLRSRERRFRRRLLDNKKGPRSAFRTEGLWVRAWRRPPPP